MPTTSKVNTNLTTEKRWSRKDRELKTPHQPTEREIILAQRKEAQLKKRVEQDRQREIRRKVQAAVTIQQAWRRYRSRHTKVSKQIASTARSAVRRRRLRTTEAEWERQIAALTIQLAWRKFFRRKLLRQIHPNRRQLQLWDPDVVASKQRALVHQIYSEAIYAPFWHPTLKPAVRPFWHRLIPSAAALSYNFAVDQYHPECLMRGMAPSLPEERPPSRPHSWTNSPDGGRDSERLQSMKVKKTGQPGRFSYNLSDLNM